jgi:uncharacterized protein
VAERSATRFFLLVFALSAPFWVLGAASRVELLPGLPIGALMAVCPMAAAAVLVYRERGSRGVAELLKRSFDVRRTRANGWYALILLLMPAVMVVAYWLMRLRGVPLPVPRFPVSAVPAMLVAFFIAGACEELGWSAYATDALQARRSALETGVLVGVVWAAWHVVPLSQAHRSAGWVAWWSLGTVALRVLTVWLYDGTGRSVFAAALFHATQNLSWQLFPNRGSHYDPRFVAPLLACAAAFVALQPRVRRQPLATRAAA